MQRFTRPLFGQVLIALAVGIALGIWAPEFAQKLQPLGDGFLKLIKMLIAPIVFSVVVVGICGAGELKKKNSKAISPNVQPRVASFAMTRDCRFVGSSVHPVSMGFVRVLLSGISS